MVVVVCGIVMLVVMTRVVVVVVVVDVVVVVVMMMTVVATSVGVVVVTTVPVWCMLLCMPYVVTYDDCGCYDCCCCCCGMLRFAMYGEYGGDACGYGGCADGDDGYTSCYDGGYGGCGGYGICGCSDCCCCADGYCGIVVVILIFVVILVRSCYIYCRYAICGCCGCYGECGCCGDDGSHCSGGCGGGTFCTISNVHTLKHTTVTLILLYASGLHLIRTNSCVSDDPLTHVGHVFHPICRDTVHSSYAFACR